jgi:2-oxo-4-hydroxy-4-carboxy-5-ureidoimidazoline decarboxylase
MASPRPQSAQATLGAFNAAPADAAERDVLACCASTAFAKAIAEGRPYREPAALRAAIDTAFAALTWDDIVESMNAHPRIGERSADGGSLGSSGWSAAEQSGAAAASDEVRRELAEGNLAYEKRFGHIFLICASGLSGREMLDRLQARLTNDQFTERAVVRQELLKITRLRMTKLLSL